KRCIQRAAGWQFGGICCAGERPSGPPWSRAFTASVGLTRVQRSATGVLIASCSCSCPARLPQFEPCSARRTVNSDQCVVAHLLKMMVVQSPNSVLGHGTLAGESRVAPRYQL